MRKRNIAINAWMLGGLIVLLLLATGLAAYRTVIRIGGRLSADFYYPYLKLAKDLEGQAAKQSLLSRSRPALAHAVDLLQKENMLLSARASLVHELQNENEQLRTLMKISPKGKFKAVFAETILRDTLSWSTSFTIDKGEADGIRKGDPVLATTPIPGSGTAVTALAGQIRSVSRHTAVVSTLFSGNCSVSVALPESESFGVLQGTDSQTEHTVSIRYLPVDSKYGDGEVVITSGFSGQTPPGIYIGTLQAYPDGATARISEGHLYASARLKPALNMDMIRFVVVMTRSGASGGEGTEAAP